MKKQDLIFILVTLIVVGAFVFVEPINNWFMSWSSAKDWRYMVLAFFKFAILASLMSALASLVGFHS
jgi:hypothetical protein